MFLVISMNSYYNVLVTVILAVIAGYARDYECHYRVYVKLFEEKNNMLYWEKGTSGDYHPLSVEKSYFLFNKKNIYIYLAFFADPA